VLQGALRCQGTLEVVTIPHFLIYSQKERSIQESGRAYAHSFFGMLILGSIFEISASEKKKYLRKFIKGNFYNLHLYSRKKRSREIISSTNYLFWNQSIAEAIIKKSIPLTYLAYLILRGINFHRFESIQVLKKLKRLYDKKVRRQSLLS
jgi:hypothetical protein